LLQLRYLRRQIFDLLLGLVQGCHLAGRAGAGRSAGSAAVDVGGEGLERRESHLARRTALDVGAHEVGEHVVAELDAAVELLAADDRRSARLQPEHGTRKVPAYIRARQIELVRLADRLAEEFASGQLTVWLHAVAFFHQELLVAHFGGRR
jgi:hypothetical protein